MNTTLQQLQFDVVECADEIFPHRQPQQAFLKLYEEIGEILREPRNHLEWADAFIMLLDIANQYGVSGNNITAAVYEKMGVNRRRSWMKNEMGVMQHEDTLSDETIALEVRLVDGPCAGIKTIDMQVSHSIVPVPPDEILMTNDHGTRFIYNLKYSTCRDGHYEYEIARVIE